MKKFGFATLALPLFLASCNGGNINGGSLQENRPYTITIKPFGYTFDGTQYLVKESIIELHSAAGAPDVRSIDYTAVMLNTSADIAAATQSYIVPQRGTVFGGGKGGYICTDPNVTKYDCSMGSPSSYLTGAGPQYWPQNTVVRSLFPIEWAVIHRNYGAGAIEMPPINDTAGWYAEFTFRAVQSNGRVIQWKQNYQVQAPS